MRLILLMLRKDLLRKLRAPLGLGVTLGFPIAFAAIIAMSFGGGQALPRAHILVDNRDGGFLGNAVLAALENEEAARYFDVDNVGEQGEARIARGEGSALLRIPETFTENLIDGTPTSLVLIRNPAQGIMPEVAEQVAGILVEALDAGSHVLRQPLAAIAPFTRPGAIRITDETVAAVAVAINRHVGDAADLLDPVVIRIESIDLGARADAGGAEPARYFSVFLFVFPGVAVWSLFMAGDVAMRDVLTEYEAGTLRRQLQGPASAGRLLAAKVAFTGTVCLISLAILSAVAALAADRPVDPAGYVLLSCALILAITGSGAAIYGAAGRRGRGATIASALYLVLAFAGGSFIDLDSMPGAVRAVAPVSPFYWGTQGYKALLEGGGVTEVATAALVLGTLGLVLAIAGVPLLDRRLTRGVA